MTQGRKKLPTQILKIRGSKRLYDRPKNSPIPVKGKPECPEWLKGEARREWERASELLYKQGTLTPVDSIAFVGYCILYQILKESYDKCVYGKSEKLRLTDKKANGSKCRKIELMIMKTTLGEIHKYLAEFGMTPSARSGINLPESSDNVIDKAQKWLDEQKKA